jgi:predicted RNase H-like nuclease (RuvC/YqgF family)
MATLEERVTSLEQAVTALQKEVAVLPNQNKKITNLEQKTAKAIQEVEENTTIMLGVMRSQGQDIRKIFEQLDTVGERFDRLETKIDEHTRVLHGHTNLLTQILERLPEKK